MAKLKIKCSIPFRGDWTEAALHDAFLRLCEAEPRLMALARLLERRVAQETDHRHDLLIWFGIERVNSYRVQARRLARASHVAYAGEVAEDFMFRLLIEQREHRTIPLPPPATAQERRVLTCALPADGVALDPYKHLLASLAESR